MVDKNLQQAIALGFDVEAFFGSPLGKYLIKRAEDEVDAAVEELKRADPDNAKAIRDLQNTITRAESFQYWLGDAVNAGKNAQLELLDERY